MAKTKKKPARSRRQPDRAESAPDKSKVAAQVGEPPTARWTFLTNHSHVLIVLARHPSMVLRQVASLVGITERAVQRIISELEEEGFLEREKVGRQNHYHVLVDQPLRHPIEEHRTIGDLIRLVDEGT